MLVKPSVLLIGGLERHVGKTTLSTQLLQHFSSQAPLIAAKATIYRGASERDFILLEERDPVGKKDTARLLRAGAQRVFWLKTPLAQAEKAFVALFDRCGEFPLLMESNTARRFVQPGVFLMVRGETLASPKPSAQAVRSLADWEIHSHLEGGRLRYDPNPLVLLHLAQGCWARKERPGEQHGV